jgi:solute carrier family 5 (sodium-dependent multivitamin transporter), member 6
MRTLDWIVLSACIGSIIFYGLLKNRKDKNLNEYLLGNKSLPWYHVCFSTMATQASAITFLSAPGQGFSDGLRFVQFYFGLPLAIILICAVFIPKFNQLKVFTAYEFLESRFDKRVRILTSSLFLLSRGLATGLSIYAPSIILSTIFKFDIVFTNILMGSLVLIYTVSGGTKAISHTHVQQMFFVLLVLVFVAFLCLKLLPSAYSFSDYLSLAAHTNKLNAIDFNFDPNERYNIWSGLIGGFFLQLSYFGTDQSQVGRYLVGTNNEASKLGLIANGFIKIPMQLFIVFIGVLVFMYYLLSSSPLVFNPMNAASIKTSFKFNEYKSLEKEHLYVSKRIQDLSTTFLSNKDSDFRKKIASELDKKLAEENELRKKANSMIEEINPKADKNEANYIFLNFLIDHMPAGLLGFVIAVIFTASMGSVASAYNSLAATSQLDILSFTRFKAKTEASELRQSKVLTLFWGVFCIVVANFAQKIGNSLIELVNILGSWFYGTILGIFLVAFFLKRISAKSVLISASISQIIVIWAWYKEWMAYLWLNPLGALLVLALSLIIESLNKSKSNVSQENTNS